ncbi:sigma-54-dependent transcriptional regulator [Sphingomonas morindae]|uniref:Sigma-54 dependent transcriptional regulator n=1 Tax=Sphingomonas morindae TaxID=1541170 RepID=A0ABY4XDJ3_9SPHN|nr:sigma-54 dependent transcriptional regulator [Sphingomonas morindae]USI75047.1 sigma-54 dependent transcriptional regulator [Sphingomonas morindae]
MTDRPVALVEDDADLAAATTQLLSLNGYAVQRFGEARTALAAIDAAYEGIVVTDIRMPGMSGIDLFRALHERDADLPVILITGHADVATAVDALKAGAWDFLTKPFDPDILLGAIGRATAARRLVRENRTLRDGDANGVAARLIGRSPAIQRIRDMIPVLGDTDIDVIVEGATGTGKALVARLIHRAGRRARHRFVAIDCATVPAAAVSDLFGAQGLIARADRGTLFLDNLDRAEAALQRRLIPFVEDRLIGHAAREPRSLDVRIVAALDEGQKVSIDVALYHRLAAVSLRLPRLAERPEDVPLLVAHFLRSLAEAHHRPAPALADATMLLSRRTWPGNIRELELAAERLVLGLREDAGSARTDAPLPDRVREFERAAIIDAVTAANGEIVRAIEALGIPRETFYYRVKRLGIDIAALRKPRARPSG